MPVDVGDRRQRSLMRYRVSSLDIVSFDLNEDPNERFLGPSK
jgi:hypothetical protein